MSLAAAAALRADAVAGAYKDLRALLRLLTHLTQRDLFDFDEDAASGGAPVDVAQVRSQKLRRDPRFGYLGVIEEPAPRNPTKSC